MFSKGFLLGMGTNSKINIWIFVLIIRIYSNIRFCLGQNRMSEYRLCPITIPILCFGDISTYNCFNYFFPILLISSFVIDLREKWTRTCLKVLLMKMKLLEKIDSYPRMLNTGRIKARSIWIKYFKMFDLCYLTLPVTGSNRFQIQPEFERCLLLKGRNAKSTNLNQKTKYMCSDLCLYYFQALIGGLF